MNNYKVIGFDADDTLWINETNFQNTENAFCDLIKQYCGNNEISKELFAVEMQNLSLYGYGVKGFMLSMVETAIKLSDNNIPAAAIQKILELGKAHLNKPVELLNDVETVLKSLNGKYKLILATKGDLLDQENKLEKSGLAKYFHHIEIMSEKKDENYLKLLNHLEIKPEEFLMVGNSLKSDILPVVNLGGNGIYVPFELTWGHEVVDESAIEQNYTKVDKIIDILPILLG